MKKLFFSIILSSIFIACSNTEQETSESTINNTENNGTQKGDTSSYERMPEMISDSIQR